VPATGTPRGEPRMRPAWCWRGMGADIGAVTKASFMAGALEEFSIGLGQGNGP
jgi:hypothetical protein